MEENESTPRRRSLIVREYVESIVVAIVVALILRSFVVAAYKIPTGSMNPTLKAGDLIFAWKLPYGIRTPLTGKLLTTPAMPHRGDVVVFRYPEDESLSFVKRVVGLPGDRVEIRQKRLFINEKIADYSQVTPQELVVDDIPLKDEAIFQKEKIGDKSYFVMFRRGQDDDSYGPEVVPPGKFFVLGDNRDSSDDSRFWGMVPIENMEGRAVLIWASFDWGGKSKTAWNPNLRWSRFFTTIH